LFFVAWPSFYVCDHHNHRVTISFKISTDVTLHRLNLKEEANSDLGTYKITSSQYLLVLVPGTVFILKMVHKYRKHVEEAHVMFVLIKNVHLTGVINGVPVPVAARSKAWVCGLSHAGIVGSNRTGGTDVCLLCLLGVVR